METVEQCTDILKEGRPPRDHFVHILLTVLQEGVPPVEETGIMVGQEVETGLGLLCVNDTPVQVVDAPEFQPRSVNLGQGVPIIVVTGEGVVVVVADEGENNIGVLIDVPRRLDTVHLVVNARVVEEVSGRGVALVVSSEVLRLNKRDLEGLECVRGREKDRREVAVRTYVGNVP